jgi:hypothetical protein
MVFGEVYENLSPMAKASLSLKFLRRYSLVLAIAIALSTTILENAHAQTEEFATDPDEVEALYQDGKYKEALDAWMIKAFEGEAEAQFKVGTMFREGQGVTPDPEQSVYWYLQAACQDHIAAQYNLGHAFMSGSGAEKDESEAVRWWTSAAEAGDDLAQFNVGRAYYMGIGAIKDEGEAKRWFVAAAAQGEPRSQALVNRLGWNTETVSSVAEADTTIPEPAPKPVSAAAAPEPTPAPPLENEPLPAPVTEPTIATPIQVATTEPTPPPVAEPKPVPVTEPTITSPTQVAAADPVVNDNQTPNLPTRNEQSIKPAETAITQLDDETTVPPHLAKKSINIPAAGQAELSSPNLPASRTTLPPSSQALISEQNSNTSTSRSQQTNPQSSTNPLLPARRPTAITNGPSNAAARAAVARRVEQSRQSSQARNSSSASQVTNTMGVASSSNSTRSSTRSIDTFSIDRAMVIYQDSNTQSNTLGILPTSERVDVLEKNGHWLKIRRRTGIPMWVSSRYLRTATTDAARITGSSVNVRANPTINDTNKLGYLQNGEAVGVQCAGRDWSYITSPSDFTGWVLADRSGAPAPIGVSGCPASPTIQSPLGRPANQVAAASAAVNPTEFKVTQDDTWLFAQQPGNFTIQLAKFQSPAGLTQYLQQNQLSGDSLVKQFTQASPGQTQAYVLYGSYRTQTEALQKAREIGAVNPWVRNISVVRENRCRRWNIQKIGNSPANRYCT